MENITPEREEVKADDGGPAFPQGIDEGASEAGFPIVQHTGGMTLRDYFAAKALQGELAAQGNGESWANFDALAVRCRRIADAMLRARRTA
jgi:hypothetical protein